MASGQAKNRHVAQDSCEESAEVTAVALPYHYVIDDAVAGYPAALIAARLGLSRFNNPGLMPNRGSTTAELYIISLEALR